MIIITKYIFLNKLLENQPKIEKKIQVCSISSLGLQMASINIHSRKIKGSRNPLRPTLT